MHNVDQASKDESTRPLLTSSWTKVTYNLSQEINKTSTRSHIQNYLNYYGILQDTHQSPFKVIIVFSSKSISFLVENNHVQDITSIIKDSKFSDIKTLQPLKSQPDQNLKYFIQKHENTQENIIFYDSWYKLSYLSYIYQFINIFPPAIGRFTLNFLSFCKGLNVKGDLLSTENTYAKILTAMAFPHWLATRFDQQNYSGEISRTFSFVLDRASNAYQAYCGLEELLEKINLKSISPLYKYSIFSFLTSISFLTQCASLPKGYLPWCDKVSEKVTEFFFGKLEIKEECRRIKFDKRYPDLVQIIFILLGIVDILMFQTPVQYSFDKTDGIKDKLSLNQYFAYGLRICIASTSIPYFNFKYWQFVFPSYRTKFASLKTRDKFKIAVVNFVPTIMNTLLGFITVSSCLPTTDNKDTLQNIIIIIAMIGPFLSNLFVLIPLLLNAARKVVIRKLEHDFKTISNSAVVSRRTEQDLESTAFIRKLYDSQPGHNPGKTNSAALPHAHTGP